MTVAQTSMDTSSVDRGQKASMRALASKSTVGTLVEWLRDDDVRWNATAAGAELEHRSLRAANHQELIRWLEPELNSADVQLSKVALGILQRLGRKGIGLSPVNPLARVYPPSSDILRANVEMLQNYTTCRYPEWVPGSASQRDCVLYLLRVGPRHRSDLEPLLWRALEDSAERGAWIYAYLLAKLGSKNQMDRLAPILIQGLKHNYLHDDGLMCLNALYRLGPEVMDQAQAALEVSHDRQQIRALKLLLFELGRSSGTRVPAALLGQLTWKCQNPIRSWRFGRDSH
jgi:hypothetical protein